MMTSGERSVGREVLIDRSHYITAHGAHSRFTLRSGPRDYPCRAATETPATLSTRHSDQLVSQQ